jgi:aspartyl-tRNA(Asn)/glutamyl-tRNA(Gln) amidotransferase subunit A
MDLEYWSAAELRAGYEAGRVSPVDVVERLLKRIETLNPRLNAFYTVNSNARKAAQEAERALKNRDRIGPLHGIPISVKDLIPTAGLRTTRGSAIFADWIPTFNAPTVERAISAGAIVLGKTSTAEFGWKGVTDCPLFGVSRNPWNPDLTPGGSSGGAAAAVAAGMGPIAVATDAAGSTRLPSAFCGVFGFKPSFGRIPIYPAPAADTLVHVGLISRTVSDCALFLSVVAGQDDRDRNSLPDSATGPLDAIALETLRVAWCPHFGNQPIDPKVVEHCTQAVKKYESAGLRVEEVSPDLPDISEVFRTLYHGTFGAQLFDALPKWREHLDPGLAAMAEQGSKLTAYDLTKAGMARAAYYDALFKALGRFDIVLLPVAGSLPFRIGSNVPSIQGVTAGYPDWLGFLYPFNITGQPAVSIPCGWTADGLPVGLQIVGKRFEDGTLLRVARRLEEILPWGHRRPTE